LAVDANIINNPLCRDQFVNNQIKPIKRPFKPTKQMAWVSQMIGMIQYHIIPVPTVSGMYGADTATVLQVEMVKRIEDAVHEFCSN
jgi:hypothetical protein